MEIREAEGEICPKGGGFPLFFPSLCFTYQKGKSYQLFLQGLDMVELPLVFNALTLLKFHQTLFT